jgi:hypothetical protein
MTRLGRREDRAAAYERFIYACTRAVRASQLVAAEDSDRRSDYMSDVLATWQAIHLRANKNIRAAADRLARRVIAIADNGSLGESERWIFEIEEWDIPGRPDLEQEFGVDLSRQPDTLFLVDLKHFIEQARLDLLQRWWHSALPPRLRRWVLLRK